MGDENKTSLFGLIKRTYGMIVIIPLIAAYISYLYVFEDPGKSPDKPQNTGKSSDKPQDTVQRQPADQQRPAEKLEDRTQLQTQLEKLQESVETVQTQLEKLQSTKEAKYSQPVQKMPDPRLQEQVSRLQRTMERLRRSMKQVQGQINDLKKTVGQLRRDHQALAYQAKPKEMPLKSVPVKPVKPLELVESVEPVERLEPIEESGSGEEKSVPLNKAIQILDDQVLIKLSSLSLSTFSATFEITLPNLHVHHLRDMKVGTRRQFEHNGKTYLLDLMNIGRNWAQIEVTERF